MAQRITRLTTDQKIAGSNPAGIEVFFSFFHFPSSPLHFFLSFFTFLPFIFTILPFQPGYHPISPTEDFFLGAWQNMRPRVGSNHQPFG